MISPGIYILKEVEVLVEELSGRPGGLTRVKADETPAEDGSRPPVGVTTYLREREDGWCHIEIAGDEKGALAVLEFLTGHKLLEDVLVWDFNHELKEYSYTFFRRGKILEQFSVKGPVLDSVSFVSDLRKVQLKDLINGFDFAMEAIQSFGISAKTAKVPGLKQVRLDFALPPKRSIWQNLLGSLSGKE